MSRLEIDFPRVLDRVQGLPDRHISNRVDQEVETFALALDVLQLPHVIGQSGLKSNFSVSKLIRFKFQKLKKPHCQAENFLSYEKICSNKVKIFPKIFLQQ